MKKTIAAFALILSMLAASWPALAFTAYCQISGSVVGQDGSTLQPGAQLTVFRVVSTTGSVILNQKKSYTLLASGAWSPLLRLEKSSVAYIYLNAPGFDADKVNGSPVGVPNSDTATLASLTAAVSLPSQVPVAIPATISGGTSGALAKWVNPTTIGAASVFSESGSAGSVSGGLNVSGSVTTGDVVNVKSSLYGAKGDAKIVNDAAMSASSATLTSATASFTSADVGKLVDVSRVGASTTLMAVITAYTSATVVTLSVPASYTGSSKTISLDSATIATGSMTAGSATLTAGSSFFTSDDVGKLVSVTDVGAKNKAGTISGFTNSTTVTLSFSSSVAATATRAIYGTNDRAAIVSAVTALPNGGTVYFPKGNYAVGSSNAITASNLLFTGAGMNASVIYSIAPVMLDSATDFDILNINNNTSNIGFRELGFSGTNWNGQTTTFGATGSSGVYVSTSNISNISADHCRFDSFWGIGLHGPGSASATIAGSTAVKDVSITNCVASFNSYDGLNPNPVGGLIVRGCRLTYNGTAGLEAATGLADISGNICYYNFQGGLSIGGYGSTQTSDAVSITANDCEYNGAYGINLASNQANTTVVGNTCRANGSAGIQSIAGGSSVDKNSIIANNVISSNNSNGLLLGHSYTLIQGNKIYSESGLTGYSQSLPLNISGDRCTLIGNEVSGPGGTDIFVIGANTYFGADNVYDPAKVSCSGSILSPSYRGYKSQLPNTTATGFIDIALPTDTIVSGWISYRAFKSGSGENQVRSGMARFSAVQHSGSYVSEIVIINEGVSVTSGTLTLSFSIVSGTNKITIKATGNSSVFGGGAEFSYTIHNESTQAITPL